jgi:hypothetical protein
MAVQRDRRVFRLNVMQGSLVPLGIALRPLPQLAGARSERPSPDAKYIAAFSMPRAWSSLTWDRGARSDSLCHPWPVPNRWSEGGGRVDPTRHQGCMVT